MISRARSLVAARKWLANRFSCAVVHWTAVSADRADPAAIVGNDSIPRANDFYLAAANSPNVYSCAEPYLFLSGLDGATHRKQPTPARTMPARTSLASRL